jgi:hypothetical protein
MPTDVLVQHLKRSVMSSRDAAAFLKKRAAIEMEYAKQLSSLSTIYLSSTDNGKYG